MPAISVIIPTYNRAQLVEMAVQSVLAQTFRDYEVIVVDDGSTDETEAVVAGLGPQVRYLRRANQGPSVARNTGISAARGAYISFLDSDDVFRPQNLELLLEQFGRNPGAAIVHGWAETVDHAGRKVQWSRPKLKGYAYRNYLFSNPTPIGTLLARRDCFADGNLFDPSLPIYEDWDLWLRLSFSHEFDYVPAVIADVVFQSARRNTRYPPAQVAETVRAIYAKLLDDPVTGSRVRPVQRHLAANARVLSGHQCRVFEDDLAAARREFLAALRVSPGFAPAYIGLLESLAGGRLTHWLRVVRSRLWRLSS